MAVSRDEIGIERARRNLGELADAAHFRGEITYLTKYGRRHAAIVPTGLASTDYRRHVAQAEDAAPPREYVLSMVEGGRGIGNGHDLSDPDSPISGNDLDDETSAWLEANNFDTEHPERWVLVTPADEDPNAANVIATRVVHL